MGNQLAPMAAQQPDYSNLPELGSSVVVGERLRREEIISR